MNKTPGVLLTQPKVQVIVHVCLCYPALHQAGLHRSWSKTWLKLEECSRGCTRKRLDDLQKKSVVNFDPVLSEISAMNHMTVMKAWRRGVGETDNEVKGYSFATCFVLLSLQL